MTNEIKLFLNGIYPKYVAYKGNNITEDEWEIYVVDGYYFLQYLSTNKFSEIVLNAKYETQVELAIMNIVDVEVNASKRKAFADENLGIASESIKSHSISYEGTSAMVDDLNNVVHQDKVNLAKTYLLSTGIFYRGL